MDEKYDTPLTTPWQEDDSAETFEQIMDQIPARLERLQAEESLELDRQLDDCSGPDESVLEGLTPRQRKFADLYLAGNFAKHAAIMAGYSEKSAARIGSRLLKHPPVVEYIANDRERRDQELHLERHHLSGWLWNVMNAGDPDPAGEGQPGTPPSKPWHGPQPSMRERLDAARQMFLVKRWHFPDPPRQKRKPTSLPIPWRGI